MHYKVPIEGQHVVIIGRGLTIGRPLANLLSLKEPHANATVTVCHTGTNFLPDVHEGSRHHRRRRGPAVDRDARHGAARRRGRRTRARRWRAGGSIPDVDEACAEVAGWITPRLGGVGPTTRAMLLRQTVEAAERRAGAAMTAAAPQAAPDLRGLRHAGRGRRRALPVVRARPARRARAATCSAARACGCSPAMLLAVYLVVLLIVAAAR